ncbi:hypothetical protein [Kangiella sp. TOML190]|uniref:hypothetical protein n=1 Tax=Kangiella sp. TOML190 TaxID=2931351 RepID=UPI00203D0EFE
MKNNPLSYTDPTGYFFKKLAKGLKKLWNEVRPFVGMIVGTILSIYCPPCTASVWGAIGAGAAAGAAGAAATGGNILKGAAIGAFSGALTYKIGEYGRWAQDNGYGGSWKVGVDASGAAVKVNGGIYAQMTLAHAMVGGVQSELQGGKFGHGFMSAGLGKSVAPFTPDDHMGAFAVTAIVGGTGSVISGGKFANGANSAAMGFLFNYLGTEFTEAMKNFWNGTESRVAERVNAAAPRLKEAAKDGVKQIGRDGAIIVSGAANGATFGGLEKVLNAAGYEFDLRSYDERKLFNISEGVSGIPTRVGATIAGTKTIVYGGYKMITSRNVQNLTVDVIGEIHSLDGAYNANKVGANILESAAQSGYVIKQPVANPPLLIQNTTIIK